jgi:outer membrane lipoprotein-sorting protein
MSRLIAFVIALTVCASVVVCAAPTAEQDLKARIESATKDFRDMTMTVTVKDKNKAALKKVDESYARLYDFQTATLSVKTPDRIRIDSKVGMVKVEYIISGGKKIFRASKFRQTDDYSKDPAKLQTPLDVGLVTPQLWENRKVEILDDPQAQANGEIKLKLTWFKGDMCNLAWIDATNLWLKRFEKHDGAGNLKARVVYSNPVNAGGVIWMPTRVELYASDGTKAGTTELSGAKVNTNLPDTLFQ